MQRVSPEAMEASAAAQLQPTTKYSFSPAFLTQEPNTADEPLKGTELQRAVSGDHSPLVDTPFSTHNEKKCAPAHKCTAIVPQRTTVQALEKREESRASAYLTRCIEDMRHKLEIMKSKKLRKEASGESQSYISAGASFAFLVSVKEREAQNVQRLLHQTRAAFLKRLDKCREHREKHEARKARFKNLVLARSRLIQRSAEKAEECRRLLLRNTKETQAAEKDFRVLRVKSDQVLQQCASIERLADLLKPFKAFVEAAARLCVTESAEGLVKRVTTLQHTNDELRRQLKESSSRLEEKRAEHNARHAQTSMRRLALASQVSCLRSQLETLRQTRQELEQGIDSKAYLLAKDAAAVGAVCTHVQMLHTRLHQTRFAKKAAGAAAVAAVESTSATCATVCRTPTFPAPNSKLCLDVMRALRLLQQIGDLATKYKSMIKAAERDMLPRRHKAVQGQRSATTSPGQAALLVPQESHGTLKEKRTTEYNSRAASKCTTGNGPSRSNCVATGRYPSPAQRASANNAGQENSERVVGSSPRVYISRRNGTPNHVTLLYEERGYRVAAAPGEEEEDVVQFLLLDGVQKNSPYRRGSISRNPPPSVSAALVVGNSNKLIREKESSSSVSSRNLLISSIASSPSQTSAISFRESPLLQERSGVS